MFYTQSAVRGPQSVLYTDRINDYSVLKNSLHNDFLMFGLGIFENFKSSIFASSLSQTKYWGSKYKFEYLYIMET